MGGKKLSLIRSKLNDRRFLIAYGEVIDELALRDEWKLRVEGGGRK